MQVVYFLISFVEVILTIALVFYLIKATKRLDAINCNLNYKIKKFENLYELIAQILNFTALSFQVYEKYKGSIKEFKNVANALLSVKKIIDTYAFLLSLTTIKKLGFLLFLKKLIFKKK